MLCIIKLVSVGVILMYVWKFCFNRPVFHHGCVSRLSKQVDSFPRRIRCFYRRSHFLASWLPSMTIIACNLSSDISVCLMSARNVSSDMYVSSFCSHKGVPACGFSSRPRSGPVPSRITRKLRAPPQSPKFNNNASRQNFLLLCSSGSRIALGICHWH